MSATMGAVRQPAAEGRARRNRLAGAIAGIALGVGLRLLPTPDGLTPVGHSILAILVLTVFFWIFNVLGNAPASILMLALMILAGVKPAHALSAFSAVEYWILLVVLFYGYAMQSTGLARRLTYVVLNWFPATYAGILISLFIIGLALSFGIPSMTVRTAILVPITWALVQELGLTPLSRGASLIMLSTVEMAVIPGCATLYGSLWGPLMVSLFKTQGWELNWIDWFRAMALPTMLWSVLLLVGNWIILRPEKELAVEKAFSKTELAKLGNMSLREKLTAGIVILSIAYWVTQGRLHSFPSYLIGMFAMAAFAASGILQEKDFGGAVSWSLLLFLGAAFSLPTIIKENRVSDWLSSIIVPIVHSVSDNVLALAFVLFVAMLLAKFSDPTGFLAMTVLFLPVSSMLRGVPIDPIVLIATLLIAGHPMWTLYENMWVALAYGMTGGQAFSISHLVRAAHVYFIMSALALLFAVGYWRFAGLWN
ncbi:MAG: anion permease [Acidobacteria bacterium]|nr:anion permease [Acidobacteriota bacterium]